jgi:hypothetical protein
MRCSIVRQELERQQEAAVVLREEAKALQENREHLQTLFQQHNTPAEDWRKLQMLWHANKSKPRMLTPRQRYQATVDDRQGHGRHRERRYIIQLVKYYTGEAQTKPDVNQFPQRDITLIEITGGAIRVVNALNREGRENPNLRHRRKSTKLAGRFLRMVNRFTPITLHRGYYNIRRSTRTGADRRPRIRDIDR